MEKKQLKKLIIVLSTFFIIVIGITISMNNSRDEKKKKQDSFNSNTTSNENIDNRRITSSRNIITNYNYVDTWDIQEEDNKQEYKLETQYDTFSYFLVKQCLEKFYTIDSVKMALDMIDKEALDKVGINKNNVSVLYNNFNNPQVCIDRILKQKLDNSKDLYVVYYRLQRDVESDASVENSTIFIKIDRKNITFSVYPYEYLKKFEYTELDYNNQVNLSNLEDIIENEYNKYETDLISKDDETCIQELYDRFKFDIQFDISGLYDKIDLNYRLEKFKSIDDLKIYVQDNKNKVIDSKISKYKVEKITKGTEYVVICDESTYIFKTENLMNYKIILDGYTVMADKTKKSYVESSPDSKARYCIKRTIRALNKKDYNFVYSKLDIIQKNNKYKTLGDFKEFVNKTFYEETSYEILNEYQIIAKNVYQYRIKIEDATKKEFTYKRLIATVTLEEDDDFLIGFVKDDNI